jgi:hypothetical protein
LGDQTPADAPAEGAGSGAGPVPGRKGLGLTARLEYRRWTLIRRAVGLVLIVTLIAP